MEWNHTELCYFWKKTSPQLTPGLAPESTAEDSLEPHSGALPGKCAHAGKVPKYENFQSWGIPEEFSSSNYRREEDREDFWKSRIPTTSCSGSSPIATQGTLGPPNVGNRSVSRFCRSRRWDPAGKSAKKLSEVVARWCALTPSLHPVRHLWSRRRIVRSLHFSRFS